MNNILSMPIALNGLQLENGGIGRIYLGDRGEETNRPL